MASPTARRLPGVALALATTVLVVSACTGGGLDEPPVQPEASVGAGEPVAEGFAVADGTVLIGAAIPAGISLYMDGEPVIDEGWTATTLLNGADPLDTLGAYIEQGRAQGLTPTEDFSSDLARSCQPDAAVDEPVVVCRVGLAAPDGLPSLTLELRRGEVASVPQDHLVLRYSTVNEISQGRLDVEPLPEAPTRWPEPPEPGDPIGADLDGRPDQVRLEEGSELAGPPVVAGVASGQEAILVATQAPDEVFARYREQLESDYGEVNDGEIEVGDAVMTTVNAGGVAGGDGVVLTMVEREGEPTLLTVRTYAG